MEKKFQVLSITRVMPLKSRLSPVISLNLEQNLAQSRSILLSISRDYSGNVLVIQISRYRARFELPVH